MTQYSTTIMQTPGSAPVYCYADKNISFCYSREEEAVEWVHPGDYQTLYYNVMIVMVSKHVSQVADTEPGPQFPIAAGSFIPRLRMDWAHGDMYCDDQASAIPPKYQGCPVDDCAYFDYLEEYGHLAKPSGRLLQVQTVISASRRDESQYDRAVWEGLKWNCTPEEHRLRQLLVAQAFPRWFNEAQRLVISSSPIEDDVARFMAFSAGINSGYASEERHWRMVRIVQSFPMWFNIVE